MVNTLRERDQVLVTLADLVELLPGRSPQSTARALRQAGWLFSVRTRGVWGYAAARLAAPQVPGFIELEARLLVRPDTPACISGKSVAALRCWLWRPVGPSICMPPGVKVPQCLDDYHVDRWVPQIGFGRGRWSAYVETRNVGDLYGGSSVAYLLGGRQGVVVGGV